jgi:hypothetical protein
MDIIITVLVVIVSLFLLLVIAVIYSVFKKSVKPKKLVGENYNITIPQEIKSKRLAYHYEKVKIAIIKNQEPDFSQINLGDDIKFIQEPSNPHDNKAVAVISKGIKLGYIYRGTMQDMINDYINRGDPIFSCVKTIDDGNKLIYLFIGFYKKDDPVYDDEDNENDEDD